MVLRCIKMVLRCIDTWSKRRAYTHGHVRTPAADPKTHFSLQYALIAFTSFLALISLSSSCAASRSA